VATVFLCLGCAAQANSPELDQRIERQVRIYLSEKITPTVNITVGPRTPSADFPGYDKVAITLSHGGRKQDLDFLVSKDGTKLVRAIKWDISKDPYAELMKKIDISGRPVRGNKDAKITIVNFDDLECPFCSRMHEQLSKDVLKMYGDKVRIIYKDFPLTEIHPWATHAAIDANCLAAQNNDAYWEFADYTHANQKQLSADMKPPFAQQFAALDKTALEIGQRRSLEAGPLQACIKEQKPLQVAASMKEGNELGISATPTLFINGEEIDGAAPINEVQAAVNRALRDAGEPLPMAAMETKQPAKNKDEPPASK